MKEKFRMFRLLLYKNYLVRKRHWKMALFVEILIPILIFMFIQACRDFSAEAPKPYSEDSHYEMKTKKELTSNANMNTNIYFVPENKFTRLLMEKFRNCLGITYEKLTGFYSEKEMLKKYAVYQAESANLYYDIVAIILDGDVNITAKDFKYRIRTTRGIPNIIYKIESEEFKTSLDEMFIHSPPFAQIQMCLDEAIIKMKAPNQMYKTQVSLQQMPYPPYISLDPSDAIARILYCAFAVIAFLVPLCVESTYAAKEKFIGINVLMAMNGVPTYLNLLSWLVSGLIFSISYVTGLIILFNSTFTSNVHSYLHYGDSFIFWLVLMLHIAHLLTFGMHISAYFSRSLFMMSGILVIYGGSSMIHKFSIKGDDSAIVPYLGIFFPNILLFRAFQELNNYETMLTGIHWSNLFEVGDPTYKTAGSIGVIMIFSVIGAIFHFAMTVYVYAVHPGKYGVKKHPFYFFKFEKSKNKIISDEEMDDYELNDLDGKPFESVPKTAYTPGIQIRNLKKAYRTHLFNKAKVQALRGISVDFYKGQITALLGHNGAGKTTLMSILTGMISPSAGTVFLNGRNIQDESDVIMSDVGLCPQENMLFPNLSVSEQIEFFGMLKGENKSNRVIKSDVNNLLQKLKLFDKKDALPNQLSGGQKRRVCLGMAVIGDSSTLILDEPTSGMDPESRRDTWDIILKMRGQKTILISTHDMEEADILGDRIAIVHMGRLKSYGTAMFLKKLLGRGNIEVTLSIENRCDARKVRDELDSRGQILSVDGGKVVLSIPYSQELPDALDKIEAKKKVLGITGMSVSLITLEQVFLKVTKDSEDVTDSACRPFMDKALKLTGQQLFMHSALALLKKKMTYTQKNITTICLILLLPLLSILLMAMDYNLSDESPAPMSLDLNMYPQPKTYFKSDIKIPFGESYKLATEKYGAVALNSTGNDSLTSDMLEFGKHDIAAYRNHLISAAEFNVTDDGTVLANAFYSSYATFSIPISINLLSNALLKSIAGNDHSISVSIHQLPDSIQSQFQEENDFDIAGTAMLFVFFLFPAIALFVIHPLREAHTNVKQLQMMTGVSCFTYWGTMFIFDFIVFSVCIVFITIGFVFMDKSIDLRIYEHKEIGITVLMLILLAINVLPLIYICSFWKKSTSTVLTLLSLLPFGLVTFESIMSYIAITLPQLKVVKVLRALQKMLFMMVPYLSYFHGQISFYITASQNARCRRLPNFSLEIACQTTNHFCCDLECHDGKCKKSLDYFNSYKGDLSLKESIMYLSLTPIIYIGIIAVLEYKLIPLLLARIRRGKYEAIKDPCDEQVKNEKQAVAFEIARVKTHYDLNSKNKSATIKSEANGNAPCEESNALSNNDTSNNFVFLVYELSKRYGKLLAVEEISFGVKQHECFGLLGVNGAGKSTTFRMMTGESIPNSGLMFLDNKDYESHRQYCLAQMGYCPQNDANIRCLNAYDHLKLFARLRGIPEKQVHDEVKKWIDRLNLNMCASQPSGTYSGGNKRRLNIAMALIGHPNLILMDEPTTGVDPAARRSLWNVIQSCQTAGQAIILTSHSMEECEALCNRLVIMVNGQLVCVGQCQELKQRFSAGYDIQLKLNPEKSNLEMNDIKKDMEQALNCELVDENSGFLMYHVTSTDTTWRRMYDLMDELRSKYSSIDDFSVLSSTLEQLFLLFARKSKHSNHKMSYK